MSLLSQIYQLGQSVHRRLVGRRSLPRPVLSVGGLSSGGAGKTPIVASLAAALKERGWSVVILSRGYGRTGRGIEAVKPWESGAARRYGDEPVLLARGTGVPVVVGSDRWRAGMWALERLTPQVFLLDDGFQHWGLTRDFDLVVIDATEDPEAIRLLPEGRWREPLTALRRSSACVLNRCNQTSAERLERWHRAIQSALAEGEKSQSPMKRRRLAGEGGQLAGLELPVFECDLIVKDLGPGPVPELEPGPWAGRKVALASAIASPESFERSANEIGLTVLEHLKLRDHAVLGNTAMMQLMSRAASAGAEAVVVTEKDAVKLDLPPDAPLRVVVLGVEPKLRKREQLLSLVEACLRVGAP